MFEDAGSEDSEGGGRRFADMKLFPEGMVAGAATTASLVAQTSVHSSIPSSTISNPFFVNRAILASVPASTMVLVMTLCACRL